MNYTPQLEVDCQAFQSFFSLVTSLPVYWHEAVLPNNPKKITTNI